MSYKHPARKFREAKESLDRKGAHPDYILDAIEEMQQAFYDIEQVLSDHGIRPCSNDKEQWMQSYQGDPDCGEDVLKRYCPVCDREVVRNEWGTPSCSPPEDTDNDPAD